MTTETKDQSKTDFFCYKPLDLSKAAIRLVQLLPELSPIGLIQCTISHETTDALYTCLSYRWGAREPSGPILINNRPFQVRRNLWEFLHMARKKEEAARVYWIDALCIDQSKTSERNHQVAQMGQIYSRAACVYVWLGANPKLAPVLHIFKDPEKATLDQWSIISTHKRELERYICGNEYWERAWIVQEIFLARTVQVWLDNDSLLFEHLHWSIDYFYLAWRNHPIARFKLSNRGTPTPRQLTSTFEKAKILYHGASLPALLTHFRNMKCEVPRDRIISLLSMCTEAHKFEVDYGSTDVDACVDILKQCSSSLCLCTPRLLAESIQLRSGYWNVCRPDDEDCVFMEMEMPGVSFTTKKVYELDGQRYMIRDLRIQWKIYDGREGPQPCTAILRLLKYISDWQGILVSGVPKLRKGPRLRKAILRLLRHTSEQQGTPFGVDARRIEVANIKCQPVTFITVPDGQTVCSYLEERGAVDISSNWRLEYDRKETCWYAEDLSIQEKDANTSIIRVLLFALPRISGWTRDCVKARLGHVDSIHTDSAIGQMKMQVKRGPWVIKTRKDEPASIACSGNDALSRRFQIPELV